MWDGTTYLLRHERVREVLIEIIETEGA